MKRLSFLFFLIALLFLVNADNMYIYDEFIVDNASQVITLPDTSKSEKNKGFTCTGLTYDNSENCFYISNYGRNLPEDTEIHSSIIKLSADGKTILDEIDLTSLIPYEHIQGVTLDYKENCLWFATYDGNALYQINKQGEFISRLPFYNANSVAYDNRTDSLWVLSSDQKHVEIYNITKSGNINAQFNFQRIKDADQLFLDEQENALYFSAGANYHGKNYIYKINLSEEDLTEKYILPDSYAIEGITIKNNTLYVANDGYYHSSKIPINCISIYDNFK